MTLAREVDEHEQQVVLLALAMKILTVFYKNTFEFKLKAKAYKISH